MIQPGLSAELLLNHSQSVKILLLGTGHILWAWGGGGGILGGWSRKKLTLKGGTAQKFISTHNIIFILLEFIQPVVFLFPFKLSRYIQY